MTKIILTKSLKYDILLSSESKDKKKWRFDMTQQPPTIVLFILLFAFCILGAHAISKFIMAAKAPGPWPKWFIIPLFLFSGLGMVAIFAELIFWITGRNKYVLTFILTVVFMTGPVIHLIRWGRNLIHGKKVKDHFSNVDGSTTLAILNTPIGSVGTVLIAALSLFGTFLIIYILFQGLWAMLF